MTITAEGFKEKWIEALMGDDYFQAEGALRGTPHSDASGKTLAFEAHGEYYSVATERDLGESPQELHVIDTATDPVGFCCLGLGIVLTGGDPDPEGQDGEMPSHEWCALVGIPYSLAEDLASKNDGGSTFHDIGKFLKEQAEADSTLFVPYELFNESEE